MLQLFFVWMRKVDRGLLHGYGEIEKKSYFVTFILTSKSFIYWEPHCDLSLLFTEPKWRGTGRKEVRRKKTDPIPLRTQKYSAGNKTDLQCLRVGFWFFLISQPVLLLQINELFVQNVQVDKLILTLLQINREMLKSANLEKEGKQVFEADGIKLSVSNADRGRRKLIRRLNISIFVNQTTKQLWRITLYKLFQSQY